MEANIRENNKMEKNTDKVILNLQMVVNTKDNSMKIIFKGQENIIHLINLLNLILLKRCGCDLLI